MEWNDPADIQLVSRTFDDWNLTVGVSAETRKRAHPPFLAGSARFNGGYGVYGMGLLSMGAQYRVMPFRVTAVMRARTAAS